MHPTTSAPDRSLHEALDTILLGPDDVAPPAERLSALRRRVMLGTTQEALAPTPVRARAPRGRRWLAAAAVGAVLVTGAGVVPGVAAEAHAEQVLTDLAYGIRFTDDDLRPGPGQYLRIEYRMTQRDPMASAGAGSAPSYGRYRYIPADPGADAVDEPIDVTPEDGWGPDDRTAIESYSSDAIGLPALRRTLGVGDLAELPREPEGLLAFFRSRYQGGSASRDENLFVQLTDTLREPGLPADLRRALVVALAQAPGVRVEESVELADGRVGVGISRGAPLRLVATEQMVLDPTTGQVIGERDLGGVSLGEFGVAPVVAESSTRLSVVDSAPKADRHITYHYGDDGSVWANDEDITVVP